MGIEIYAPPPFLRILRSSGPGAAGALPIIQASAAEFDILNPSGTFNPASGGVIIPAGTINTNTFIYTRMWGTLINNSGAPQTVTIRTYCPGATILIATPAVSLPASGANRYTWWFESLFGATTGGAVQSSMRSVYGAPVPLTVPGTTAGLQDTQMGMESGSSMLLTDSNLMRVTLQFGAALAALQYEGRGEFVVVLKQP